MANYMKDVAKMLGVELGEEFLLEDCDGEFYLHQNGLYCRHNNLAYDATLRGILSGTFSIKRKPWKPKKEQDYYYICEDGSIESSFWLNDVSDLSFYKLGNCYRTRQEAEANRDKWIAFYESDEVLEV